MGLPRDVATHIVGAGLTAPYPERCAFTPIRAHTFYGHTVSGRSQGDMVPGLATVATPKGLESELMGLPMDVATHIEIGLQASPASWPCAPRSHHTPTIRRGVNATFTQGYWEPGWLPPARAMFLYLHYLAPALSGDSQEC